MNELNLLHEQWLQNPTTRQFLKLLAQRKTKYVDAISANAYSGDEKVLRSNANYISCIDVVTAIATDTQKFVEQSQTK